MNIVGKKKIYFLISLVVLIPGLISLFFYGLKLSIDFTGGSRITLVYEKGIPEEATGKIENVFRNEKLPISSLQISKEKVFIKSAPIEKEKHEKIISTLKAQTGDFKEENFETVGPTIGQETTVNAVKAVLFASVLIVLYIAWSFRKVPKPASSFRFGICAIAALLHDVLVVVGVFSLLGHFYGVEVDSLFITALLTVIGFSVHDTIVVFDRIRENLRRMPNASFAHVVNESIVQTFTRSLNTSLTTMLVLFTMLLFGGESVRWFLAALLLGIASGTYSSIFNAAPLLVVWEEWSRRRKI